MLVQNASFFDIAFMRGRCDVCSPSYAYKTREEESHKPTPYKQTKKNFSLRLRCLNKQSRRRSCSSERELFWFSSGFLFLLLLVSHRPEHAIEPVWVPYLRGYHICAGSHPVNKLYTFLENHRKGVKMVKMCPGIVPHERVSPLSTPPAFLQSRKNSK